jgi:hypothetical protein
MKKPIFFLLGIGLALFLGACDSDSDNASNTDNLTSGQWKLSSGVATFTFNGVQQTVDVYAQLPACDKDNFAEFKSDGTFVSDEGATKCNPADPQQEAGTWSFTQNETHLVVAGGDYDFDAEILELTDSRMRVKFTEDLNGIVTTTEMVFVKI